YGTRAEAAALARQLDRPGHGVEVVGTCLVDGDGSRAGAGRRGGVNGDGAPVPGGRSGAGGSGPVGTAVLEAMTAARADMLAVAGGTSPSEVRALAWALEGTGAELMIAPAVPDLAQQSVTVEPVGGAVGARAAGAARAGGGAPAAAGAAARGARPRRRGAGAARGAGGRPRAAARAPAGRGPPAVVVSGAPRAPAFPGDAGRPPIA